MPAISANALRTQVFTGGVDATAEALAQEILQDTGLLLQPFFEEIVQTGELSLLYFGGRFSHAVCKVPKPGDFRSQPSHGARISRFSPSPALREQAEAILLATPGTQPLAYARIDGFLRGDRFYVIELELIEPFLFLQDAPDPRAAARQLAESLLFAVQGSRR
jgi:glutathione synthase/RimK-type ligase-like ATP-grasp enzyme